MLRFTKRADYGLMAIHYIAIHDDLGAVNAKRIAEEFAIPQELLAKILQRLAKQGLIVSHNGPKGGYMLTRRPAEITLGEVIRALEGPIHIVSCLEESSDCPQMERCSLRRPVKKIQAAITQLLDTMSLAELTSDDVPEILTIGSGGGDRHVMAGRRTALGRAADP
jgi:Rrf2 family transcriptional regulator, cysteine metabolism repressor